MLEITKKYYLPPKNQEIKIKEGIKLNKRQFESFNDCDGYKLFEEQLKVLPEGEDGEKKIQECTDLLFEEFEYILVTPENKIFGYKSGEYTLLGQEEEAFSCAKIHSGNNLKG